MWPLGILTFWGTETLILGQSALPALHHCTQRCKAHTAKRICTASILWCLFENAHQVGRHKLHAWQQASYSWTHADITVVLKMRQSIVHRMLWWQVEDLKLPLNGLNIGMVMQPDYWKTVMWSVNLTWLISTYMCASISNVWISIMSLLKAHGDVSTYFSGWIIISQIKYQQVSFAPC